MTIVQMLYKYVKLITTEMAKSLLLYVGIKYGPIHISKKLSNNTLTIIIEINM